LAAIIKDAGSVMDAELVAWGRSVKSRRRWQGEKVPPLWLFTDAVRMADVAAAVAALPRGLCGVVFRHDGVPGRAALLGRVARLCRQRRLSLCVAGAQAGRPARAGVHLRGAQGPKPRRFATASAHGAADLVRARRRGVALPFLSPVFPTMSHPGAKGLGVLRWAAIARRHGRPVAALGGIDGGTVRRLPWPWCRAVGAITALVA
jgi:thiamine-phosphate pyrophosphorylase